MSIGRDQLTKNNDIASSSIQDYVTTIMGNQQSSYYRIFTEAIQDSFSSSNAMNTVIYDGVETNEHFYSYIRLFKLFSNMAANGGNNASENPLSVFYKIMNVNGQGSPLTPAGLSLFGLGLISLPIGIAKAIYHEAHHNEVASLQYHKKQLAKLGITYSSDEVYTEDIKNSYLSSLAREKVIDRTNPSYHNTYESEDNKESIDNTYQVNILARVLGVLDDKNNYFKNFNVNESILSLDNIKYILASIVAFASLCITNIITFLEGIGLIYSFVWFSFVLALGLLTATSISLSPIILSIALSIYLIFMVINDIRLIKDACKDENEIMKEQSLEAKQSELKRMGSTLKLRHFMKCEHQVNKSYLLKLSGTHQFERKEDKSTLPPVSTHHILSRTNEQIKHSKLYKYALKDSDALNAVNIAACMVDGILLTALIFWMISIFIAISGGAALPIFAFFDSELITGGVALVAGVLSGIKKYSEINHRQSKYEKFVHTKLCEEYKNTHQTMLEKFEELENQVAFKKAKSESLKLNMLLNTVNYDNNINSKSYWNINRSFRQKTFHAKMDATENENIYDDLRHARKKLSYELKNKGVVLDNDLLAHDYPLQNIDVYNHEYREKQRFRPTAWTYVKRAGNAIYAMLCGGQNGIYLTKLLFLSGCVMGGIAASMVGALPIFILIAILSALFVGGIALSQYYLERSRKHREKFIDNIDENISYLKKKNKELDLLIAHFDHEAITQLEDMPTHKHAAYPHTIPFINSKTNKHSSRAYSLSTSSYHSINTLWAKHPPTSHDDLSTKNLSYLKSASNR